VLTSCGLRAAVVSILLKQEEKMSKKKPSDLEMSIQYHAEKCKLDNWTAFVNPIDVPADIFPALQSGRPELIKLIQPRELTAVEAKALFNIIGTLIETNTALRDHAAFVSQFVGNWADSFKALRSVGDRIVRFAAFDHGEPEEG
jgi:hypothetical protein